MDTMLHCWESIGWEGEVIGTPALGYWPICIASLNVSLTMAVLGLSRRLVLRVLHRLYSGSSSLYALEET